jgi:catechol 2,3-dioxygenase-like lactoylglutathione lyase family enzyme
MKIRPLLALAVVAVAPLAAQLAPQNSAGVTFSHVHLNVSDIDAQKRFWIQLGGVPVTSQDRQIMRFPGGYVYLRKQVPTSGTVGSVVNHFGLRVRNIDEWIAKWKAAGLEIEPGNNSKQCFLTAPDNIRVEIIEDASLSTAVAMGHIHLFVTDPQAVQAWYVERFGATPGKRGQFDTANVPGAEITFTKSETPQAPTRGRSLDHFGFEVKNMDQFVKNLEAAGVKLDPPGIRDGGILRFANFTDPWGTYLEVTEGLPFCIMCP